MGISDSKNFSSKQLVIDNKEIEALSKIIFNCEDLKTLNQVYTQHGNYQNPQISYAFGIAFLNRGDKERSKETLIKGARFGLKFPCEYYDTLFIDAIGQCYMLLLTQYASAYVNPNVSYATALAYIYLSRSIELKNTGFYGSLRSRGILFKDHESPNVCMHLISQYLGWSVLIEPLIISDFYYASKIPTGQYNDVLQISKSIHKKLDDISIGGKDASEYMLEDIAEIGKERHLLLFNRLKEKYKDGCFNIKTADFQDLVR